MAGESANTRDRAGASEIAKSASQLGSGILRANSTDSNSLSGWQRSGSISDLSTTICKCDDCLLGITDALADLVLWNRLNSVKQRAVGEKLDKITGDETSKLSG